uniref:Uncharacterized protein n=1 Tax=Nothobranchius korthausae TaxID=1143690 RepID=A0A1A8FL49_9TELE
MNLMFLSNQQQRKRAEEQSPTFTVPQQRNQRGLTPAGSDLFMSSDCYTHVTGCDNFNLFYRMKVTTQEPP